MMTPTQFGSSDSKSDVFHRAGATQKNVSSWDDGNPLCDHIRSPDIAHLGCAPPSNTDHLAEGEKSPGS